MAFDSLEYGLLLLVTGGLFVLAGPRSRLVALITASLVFYAAWNPAFVSLIVISAVVDFFSGLYLGRTEDPRRRKLALLLSLSVNLGLLGYFKYANFFIDNVRAVTGATGDSVVDVVLPPGISFYTFQTMSYTIDVYRRRLTPTRSFLRFFLYVSFFPQLIAGPIERAGRLLGQFERAMTHRVRATNLVVGLRMILWGLAKKVVIADHFAAIADAAFSNPESGSGWTVLVGAYAFTLQIYCDFSAYSEIARGSARMFGIDLMRNFDQPYLVGNVRDFWRRWHISLSTWFRDYVYIPLGGSKGGRPRALFNLTATMFLSGLWHGAAWNFVVWGLFHGVLLLIHALGRDVWAAGRRRLGALAWETLAWMLTFHLVVLGWILFRVEALGDFLPMCRRLADLGSVSPSLPELGVLAFMGGFLVLSSIERTTQLMRRLHESASLSAVFYGAMVAAIALLGRDEGPQFIYFQF